MYRMAQMAKQRLENSGLLKKKQEPAVEKSNSSDDKDPGNMFTNLVLSTGVGQTVNAKSIIGVDAEQKKELVEIEHEEDRHRVVARSYSAYNPHHRIQMLNGQDISMRLVG